ncbi:ubiquitin carboxyl-terminal hydrolase MINDY-1 isoform X1 [Heptranchias perlo]|uniref:ubiquitin carboxyl-terminal hydrolase MINDY-1 isoform X1 n=1 Tax=Heptranchias perlo TaxID=212740 RepID=UPI003559E9DE
MEANLLQKGDNVDLKKTIAGISGMPVTSKPASSLPVGNQKKPPDDLSQRDRRSPTSRNQSDREPEASLASAASEQGREDAASEAAPVQQEGRGSSSDSQAGGESNESVTSGMASVGSEGELVSPSPSLGSREGAEEGRQLEAESLEAGSAQSQRAASPSSQGELSQSAGSRPGTSRSDPSDTFYYVKWINWKGEKTPLITQSENGPCPLIAIMNILLLRWKVKLPPKTEVISVEQLMTLLGDCVLSTKPKENSEGLQLNFEQNMSDAMAVLLKLSTGLDVNVRFTGVGDFEYTPECIVFDLLNLPLYHGWLVDPQSTEVMQAVGRCSYNQLVEKIIFSKHSTDSALVSEGLVAEQFLDATATQLTYHGLCELTATAKEGELCVFFRNNHFSTMIKHKGHLYLLVTDQGFLSEQKVVWESLHNVEGDGNFCDSEFCLSHPSNRQLPYTATQPPQQQIDQDYMVALSLQQQQQGPGDISDLELAKQLQEEEDQRALQYLQQQERETQPQAPVRQPAAAGRQAAGERRQREERSSKDCAIL